MRDLESQFREWAKPPEKTEEQRCENAEKAVKNAIIKSEKLQRHEIKVFTHGSYQNNTNVRKDSDVDIGVLCQDVFFYDLPEGYTKTQFSINDADYSYSKFKNEVGEALINYFGQKSVSRGNKAFDIHETSYHVDADVAAFFTHRRYSKGGTYLQGVELQPDNGGRIINWPDQHYANGVQKNKDTGYRFKAIVRVLKALKNEMEETKITQAKFVTGFLLECLTWNVPNNLFGHSTYSDDVRSCLNFLVENTKTDEQCNEWGEVSELKYLFRKNQKWTRQQVNDFLMIAREYVHL